MIEEEDGSSSLEPRTSGFWQTMMRTDLAFMIAVSLFMASSMSGAVGVIPDVLSDRYARLHHNYTGADCGALDITIKPTACQEGSDDAQEAASLSQLFACFFGLLLNPVVGFLSDAFGRKPAILASLLVVCFSQLIFLCTILFPKMNPMWYYLSFGLTGGFYYFGVIFAALSDIVPEAYRSGCFGVLIGVYYIGYAVGPSIPLVINHRETAMFCVSLSTMSVLLVAIFVPETLPRDIQDSNRQQREEDRQSATSTTTQTCLFSILEPIRDISILNRDWTVRLIAVGFFINSAVFAGDHIIVLYFVESHFDFDDGDIAFVFLCIGVLGFSLQAVALQPLAKFFGERNLLVFCFSCGALHNLLYGTAQSKHTIYYALMLAQVSKLNMPILHALGSNQVSKSIQGRLQGALSALNAIGTAAGPLSMQFVYHHTKDKRGYGPGFMFFCASVLYLVGATMVSLLRQKGTEARAATEAATPLLNNAENTPGELGTDHENLEQVGHLGVAENSAQSTPPVEDSENLTGQND